VNLLDAAVWRLTSLGDRFLPPGAHGRLTVQRMRATIVGSWLGLLFSVTTGSLYLWAGSAWSGLSIQLITLGLLAAPFAIRRGVSTQLVGNLMVALTAQAAVVVTWRSGGFSSPAASWFFMLPLTAYLACGHRAAVAWSLFAVAGLGAFFVMGQGELAMGHDFSPAMLSTLRISGYAGIISSMVALLLVIEGIRAASEEALEGAGRARDRERILRDLHDGVGSQLLGLITRARAGKLETATLARELEECFEDLRLIVSSMDPVEPSLEETLGELRLRVHRQCDSIGVKLGWHCDDTSRLRLSADATLQLLRAVQEMLSNALRHAKAERVALRVALEAQPEPGLRVSVEDDGVGFDAERLVRAGRGLPSLRARAQKLSGTLQVSSSSRGTRVELRIPAPRPQP
jgi:signal transduction histidine kinase